MTFIRAGKIFALPPGWGWGSKTWFFISQNWQTTQSYIVKNIFIIFVVPKNPLFAEMLTVKIAHKVVHHHPTRGWVGEVAQSMACNISKWSLWWIQLNTCISFVIQINRYSTAPSNGTNLAQAIDGAVLYLMVWITKIMHKLSCIHHKLHFDILQAILWATSPTHPLWFGREPFTFSYHFPPSHLNIWVTSEILVWKCSLTYKLHDTVCGRHLNIILESSIKKVWAKTADFFRFFRIP